MSDEKGKNGIVDGKRLSGKELERKIFEGLGLNENDRKYISMEDDDTVRIGFPISIGGIYAGGAEVELDEEAEMDLYDKVVEFYTDEMSKGGFADIDLFSVPRSCRTEVTFYKDFNTEEEALESVKWLLKFKKRFGI